MLAGQSLIERPLHLTPSAASLQVRDLLAQADLAVTNLEVALDSGGGWPVRDTTSHVAPESVLDTLAWFGFGAVALASNHAFDLGPPGILAGLGATRQRGMLAAGTGPDAVTAGEPGFGLAASRRVAMVAVVAAENPPQSHALDAAGQLPARPGVNRLRVNIESGSGEPGHSVGGRWAPEETDVMALLRHTRAAARLTDVVVVYLHNHYWATPQERTPNWVREFARRCIDNGASVVLGHGTPVLQGLEFHRGHLIAYGLGSFVFHTHRPASYDAGAWESLLVDADLGPDGTANEVRLHPVIHGCHPERPGAGRPIDAPASEVPDSGPALPEARTASRILARVAELSEPFGAEVVTTPEGAAFLRPTVPAPVSATAHH